MADERAARPLPRLRKARESRHLTQAEVAERLAELAWYRDHSRLGISSDMVSKWERGEKRPSRLYRQLLCLLFGTSLEELGLGTAARMSSSEITPVSDVPWADVLVALGADGQLLHHQLNQLWENDLVRRRELLKSIGLASAVSALDSLTGPLPRLMSVRAEPRPDPDTLDGLTSLAARYQKLYHCTAPRVLITPVAAHLLTVEALLGQEVGLRQRSRLLANHSQVSQLAGRLAFFDLRDQLSARGYFTAAYDSAIAADDACLAAGALGHLSFVSASARQWSAADDHLHHARMHAERVGNPVVRSWLAAVASEIHANARDERATLLALDEARRLLNGGTGQAQPAWFDYYDNTRFHGFEGYALLRLGRWAEAHRQLHGALRSLPSTALKQRTVFLTDLASVSIRQGDIDHACDVAVDAANALTAQPYATSMQRLRNLRSDLAPYAKSRAVRQLDDAMAQLQSA